MAGNKKSEEPEPTVLLTVDAKLTVNECAQALAGALQKAEDMGLRPVTAKEARSILNRFIVPGKYKEAFPCITSTYVDYSGTTCKITQDGKTVTKQMPAKSGMYKLDEFGLPFGQPPANAFDLKNTAYLVRLSSFKGFVLVGEGKDRNWVRMDNGSMRANPAAPLPIGVIAVEKEKNAVATPAEKIMKLENKIKALETQLDSLRKELNTLKGQQPDSTKQGSTKKLHSSALDFVPKKSELAEGKKPQKRETQYS